MKLIDLTKKKLVHKATVAAGKAPRLELGVLGISIGQEAPKGDTSKLELKWQNRGLNESMEATAEEFFDMFDFLGATTVRKQYEELLANKDLEGITADHIIETGFELLRKSIKGSAPVHTYITQLPSKLRRFNLDHGVRDEVHDIMVELDEHESKLAHPMMKDVLDKLDAAAAATRRSIAYLEAVGRTVGYLDLLRDAQLNGEMRDVKLDPAASKVLNSFMKMHGVSIV